MHAYARLWTDVRACVIGAGEVVLYLAMAS